MKDVDLKVRSRANVAVRALATKDTVPSLPFVPKMPQDFTFVNRLQWGLASVLAGMRTEAAFRPLIEPWVRSGLTPVPV